MKAIETVYRGYRFRSRLEARWAVFFDELGLKWEYEPEGFERSGWMEGNGTVRWLPDFLLTETNTWIEVKGSNEQLIEDWERLAQLLDFGGVLPDFCESADRRADGTIPGLLLLGPIPLESQLTWHPMVVHHEGLGICRARFWPGKLIRADVDWSEWNCLESGPDGWHLDHKTSGIAGCNPVYSAYLAARQARFEHGQRGAPSQWLRA
ncbi:MAG: hypothetical protein KA778_16395 [Burkholderiaceae bacterium]|nr:hypothetical protein [Burkholderiaceae bacterium]